VAEVKKKKKQTQIIAVSSWSQLFSLTRKMAGNGSTVGLLIIQQEAVVLACLGCPSTDS